MSDPNQPPAVSKARYLIPFGIFAVLVVFLAIGLGLDPKVVPSPLIGKPAPEFSLPRLDDPQRHISNADMRGKVWLLNVWASWCVSCRAEHEVIKQLARMNEIEILGLNYKDDPADAARWLQALGDPYVASAMDQDGRVGIDWGVYGVPESFLVDQQGVIRYKQIGPVDQRALQEKILPLIRELKGKS
jgi:cytochrome c biogenesis protein CcmG, thiol:disulfide interchange protein DsbE